MSRALPGWARGWVRGWAPYLATVLSFGLGMWQKWPCHAAGWPYRPELIFGRRCYSDLPVLYLDRGLAEGHFPYATARSLEYPVLTGYVMDLTARVVSGPAAFYLANVAVLLACALAVVWAAVRLAGPGAGVLVALAPAIALTGTINWDLLAVAAATLALLAWARDRPGLAGIAIGLGTAAKLYPVLLLFPIALLAWRHRRPAPALTAALCAAGSWLVVNAPVMLLYPAGWLRFWEFNADRGAEFGSVFYALALRGVPVDPLNPVAIGLLAAGLLLTAWYALSARSAPGLPVLALLTVTAFLVTNKVYSPQYVLWLLPLAVLAGAGPITLLLWQAAEFAYWYAVWGHLSGDVDAGTYVWVTFVRLGAELLLCLSVLVTVSGHRIGSLRQLTPSGDTATQPALNRPSAA